MIKMLTAIASDDFVIKINEETSLFDKGEEKNLVEAGLAEYVSAKPSNNQPKKKAK